MLWLDGVDEAPEVAPDVVDLPLLSVSHPVLDLGKGLLDGIEVGGVFGQEPQLGSGGTDGQLVSQPMQRQMRLLVDPGDNELPMGLK